MMSQVSTRIDEATKQQFYYVCDSIGISPSNAISIFIKGVINNNGIPFPVVAQRNTETVLSRENAFGCMHGKFQMAADFDAELDDLKE